MIDNPKDRRETPDDIYLPLHEEFGFTLDAAASQLNTRCARFCTVDGYYNRFDGAGCNFIEGLDGLTMPWAKGERVWCNPPFSDIEPWLAKAWMSEATAVLLMPQNRQEQPMWQRWIEGYRDRGALTETVPGDAPDCVPCYMSTRNLPGRRHYTINGGQPIMRLNKRTGLLERSSPEFGTLVLVFDRRHHGA